MGYDLCTDLGTQPGGTVIDWNPSPSTCNVQQHGSYTFPFTQTSPISVGPGTSNQGTLIGTAGEYQYEVTCCTQETATKTVSIVVSMGTAKGGAKGKGSAKKKSSKKGKSKTPPKKKKPARKTARKAKKRK